MRNEIDRLRKAEPSGRSSMQALVLMPLRRGAGDVSTVSVLRGSGHLALSLRLEENTFPRYQATLRESAARQTVWRSGSIAARSANANEMLAVEVPAALLRSATYTLELTDRERKTSSSRQQLRVPRGGRVAARSAARGGASAMRYAAAVCIGIGAASVNRQPAVKPHPTRLPCS